jgi:hypothetical protein
LAGNRNRKKERKKERKKKVRKGVLHSRAVTSLLHINSNLSIMSVAGAVYFRIIMSAIYFLKMYIFSQPSFPQKTVSKIKRSTARPNSKQCHVSRIL